MKQRITWKDILILQGVIVIYTVSQVMAKTAALEELFSIQFMVFYGIEFIALGIYAICWQQVIKKFDLSIAYANRAMALLWSLLWSTMIFKEDITVGKIAGVCAVMIGVIIINGGEQEVVEDECKSL